MIKLQNKLRISSLVTVWAVVIAFSFASSVFNEAYCAKKGKTKNTKVEKKSSKKKIVRVKKYKKIFLKPNPHHLMFKDSKIDYDICELCHQQKPNSDQKLAGSHEYLTDKVNNICSSCHGWSPHPGASEHLRKPSKKIEKRIKSWEKRFKRSLMLDKDGRVTCTTCHDPHPKNLLKAVNAALYNSKKEYMQRYGGKTSKSSPIYGANVERMKRIKVGTESNMVREDKVGLPFKQSMKDSKFCKICHKPE